MSKRKMISFVLTTILLSAHAQEATAPPSFEVASIKEADPGRRTLPSIRYLGNRLQLRDMTLQELMAIGYDLNFASDQQVIGGPGWIRTERFDVLAQEDEFVAKRLHALSANEQGDANRQLIRALLVERFGLKAHQEQHTLTAYTLEIAKGGPKLSPGAVDSHLPSSIPQSRVNIMGVGWMQAHNADMTLFAKTLESQSELNGRTVVDRTGLKGKYDFTLRWTPAIQTEDQNADPTPSLFVALQEQLGLRLTTKKAPVDVLVIDSIGTSSPN